MSSHLFVLGEQLGKAFLANTAEATLEISKPSLSEEAASAWTRAYPCAHGPRLGIPLSQPTHSYPVPSKTTLHTFISERADTRSPSIAQTADALCLTYAIIDLSVLYNMDTFTMKGLNLKVFAP